MGALPTTSASKQGHHPDAVLLVSAPWRLATWPSLAIGVLKSHLAANGIPADGVHLHFDVAVRLGFDRYDRVANGWELGEALYCALYSPDEAHEILDRTADVLTRAGDTELAHWARNGALREVEQATQAAIAALDLTKYSLAGISVGALQLGASLYLAREFKRRAPHLRVILGGGGVLGEPGANLLRAVPWVDAIVDGEGEATLAKLARLPHWGAGVLADLPNLRFRDGNGGIGRSPTSVQANIDTARPPDMGEFYDAARNAGYPRSGLVLPMEASRGCAWEHRRGDGRLRGCTFCGLYRNSPNARQKSLDALWEEMRASIARTQVLELSFIDAYLPPAYAKELLRRLATEAPDVTLFCEARCDLDEETAALLAAAGTRRLQLGVEAFHTGILSRMEKGTRTIDNIASIKLCEEFGIPFQYNVMLRVPGVAAAELRESTKLLPTLYGYRPPSSAEFYLDRGSRMYAEPERYGIYSESLDRARLCFLPKALSEAPVCQIVPFESSMDDDTRAAWDEMEAAIGCWRAHHEQRRREGFSQMLTFRDGGACVIVADHRGDESQLVNLSGRARELFLACDRPTRKRHLLAQFPDLDALTLQDALDELDNLGLVFQEAGEVLALPVRERLPGGAPRKWGRRA
ncbi:MAG: RiPP maturation radical SAM C-methyltransferase [Hyphomicrobiales bacterium]|nr:RiPP maturation radical SAM C-methyltransferase [Hyphomicrobiales bacterium]MBV8823453.1 RiPP maturation radical SAM C-methyltransferase [Hyphomicrobiales bacterium]